MNRLVNWFEEFFIAKLATAHIECFSFRGARLLTKKTVRQAVNVQNHPSIPLLSLVLPLMHPRPVYQSPDVSQNAIKISPVDARFRSKAAFEINSLAVIRMIQFNSIFAREGLDLLM